MHDEYTQTLTYDAWNHVVWVNLSSGYANYTYDALGRQINEGGSGPTSDYYYAGNQRIEQDQTTPATQQFVWGPFYQNQLVQETTPTGTYYVLQDANWNVTAVTNASTGSVVERYSFDPNGNITVMNSSGGVLGTAISASTIGQQFGFQGGFTQINTGLINFGIRWYNPATATWTQPDPIGADGSGNNLYQLEGGNAVDRLDASGLQAASVPNDSVPLSEREPQFPIITSPMYNLDKVPDDAVPPPPSFFDKIGSKLETSAVNYLQQKAFDDLLAAGINKGLGKFTAQQGVQNPVDQTDLAQQALQQAGGAKLFVPPVAALLNATIFPANIFRPFAMPDKLSLFPHAAQTAPTNFSIKPIINLRLPQLNHLGNLVNLPANPGLIIGQLGVGLQGPGLGSNSGFNLSVTDELNHGTSWNDGTLTAQFQYQQHLHDLDLNASVQLQYVLPYNGVKDPTAPPGSASVGVQVGASF